MYCTNCGKQIPDDSKFCEFCGAAVLPDDDNDETQKLSVIEENEHPVSIASSCEEKSSESSSGRSNSVRNGFHLVLSKIAIFMKRKKKELLIAAVAAAVVVCGVIVVRKVFGKRSSDVAEASIESAVETEKATASASIPVVKATPRPTPYPTSTPEVSSSDYILPDSSDSYISDKDLEKLTDDQITLARNEIYARHGRKFNDQTLQNYFNSKSWYHGTVDPDAFDDSVFNQYERANIDKIVEYQKNHG